MFQTNKQNITIIFPLLLVYNLLTTTNNQITVANEIIRGSPSMERSRTNMQRSGGLKFSGKKMRSEKKNGPETVLIKAQFLWAWNCGETRISVVKNFETMDSGIWLFSRFTTITAHFHPGSSAHAENKQFFLRRCVSKLRLSSFASWHWGWCTSIAKTWRRAVYRGFAMTNVVNVSC